MPRLLYLFVIALIVSAQTQRFDETTARTISYHLFFRNAAALQAKATELEQKTRGGGEPLVQAFSAKTGLSTADGARFLALADKIVRQLAEVDREAADIITSAKKLKTADGLIPPPPPALKELEQKRRALVRSGIDRVSAEVSPQVAATIDRYVRQPAASKIATGEERR